MENTAQRRRGVRASRVKLTSALTEAGFKTQAALAEHMANLEGLDSAPKDVVNRAFRELPVELQTLERVARALGVEAYTLYKTADEQTLPEPTINVDARPVRWLAPAAAGLGVLVLLAAGWWYFAGQGDSDKTRAALNEPSQLVLDLGTPSLVVLQFAGDENDEIGHALRVMLSGIFSVATDTANVLAKSSDPGTVAKKLRADVVVDGEVIKRGHLAGLRVFLYARGVRQQIWAASYPIVALPRRRGEIVQQATLAVKHATGFPISQAALPPHFPLAPVQDDYLEGEYYLDRASNELNIKRAQSRFEAALRQDANYARAHAGLCQSLLEEYWMSDEGRALKDAGRACGQAVQLDPDDPVVAAAHAHYLQRTGRNDEAITLYEGIVAQHPWDAAAWTALASSRLEAYRQSGDRAMLEQAKQAARTAADADPVIWKSLFSLATMEYFDGNVQAAITDSEAALARDENEFVAANLGTFYLCEGSYQKAVDAYLLAQKLAPGSYVGDEFLGMAYYFKGDFKESARLRQRAIASISDGTPEIHEMWGNLGDSYRQLGETELAIKAYLRAAEIAERDHLRGLAPAADKAARAYYYTMLRSMDKTLVPRAIEQGLAAELDEIDASLTSPTAHRRMAQTWLLRGETDKARASLARAMTICPGYGGLPDLAKLAQGR